MKLFLSAFVTRSMETFSSALSRDVLDEDMQIMRVTLATICPEVRRFSPDSAAALEEAVTKIEQARHAFWRQQESARPRSSR
jgi:hypothetical protein